MIVRFHKSFEKQYRKQPVKIRTKFQERLKLFINNPTDKLLNNHSVHPTYPNCKSINISGDYRAIYYETKDSDAIFIVIGTHAQLYK